MKQQFSVGIIDLRLDTKRVCVENPTRLAHITVSFSLRGDFLAAAVHDALDETIDYSMLSSHLVHALSDVSCADTTAIAQATLTCCTNFSPQIIGGYVSVNTHCHGQPFNVQKALL